jgi:RimJ/RimL family protein N-acetyltransferase
MIKTERLILRPWRADDLEPMAAINADPLVVRHLPGPMTRDETAAMLARKQEHLAEHGFTSFAVEVPGVAPFIGYVGLQWPGFEAHFMPAVEVGWRLASAHWGKGYATEAARAALRFGFEDLNLDQIVSFTVPANKPSWAVMERIGMTRDARDDFDHPRMPEEHPLRRHLLYRLSAADWRRKRG